MNQRSRNEARAEIAREEKEAPAERSREEDRSPAAADAAAESNWPGFLAGIAHFLRPKASSSREDIAEALLKGTGDGAFSAEERAMLTNILKLREVRVEDVMVPRAAIDGVQISASLGELMLEFERCGHSRMPVYGDGLDDPRGMVHIRDVLLHVVKSARSDEGEGGPLDFGRVRLGGAVEELGLLRKVLFVPPSMLASDLMARMQATRTQMALVIDEYGGTDGLVSLEDIIERVVGDIEDEHDEAEALIAEREAGVFEVDARADLTDVRRAIGPDFDISAHEEEADTIGGLIFSELGRVPPVGETVEALPGFAFEVLEADPRRLRRVRISRSAAKRDGTSGPRLEAVH
ncbi:hemolysin family protein [Aureimonas leprariae]|uniref:HlyC/CorC family transporter n=1 Tax=Plantimonas leprariae TaxID=2615207 RepID=A0A7V7U205_9HYPH|nr:hemolysin family protein [Aureimonas leprariae]KAB0682853.1 HlyC/CorC family transporter [Aureimonas leprariae]